MNATEPIPNPVCDARVCMDRVEKFTKPAVFPASYHGFGRVPTCEHCGGAFVDGEWRHRCKDCKADVTPGELRGLFVPTRCAGCQRKREEAQERAGNHCLKCGTIRMNCCC